MASEAGDVLNIATSAGKLFARCVLVRRGMWASAWVFFVSLASLVAAILVGFGTAIAISLTAAVEMVLLNVLLSSLLFRGKEAYKETQAVLDNVIMSFCKVVKDQDKTAYFYFDLDLDDLPDAAQAQVLHSIARCLPKMELEK